MIPSDFYPTQSGAVLSSYNYEPTADLVNIPIDTSEFTDAYWLGWVNYGNLPDTFKVSAFSIEDGVVSYTDCTKRENVPIGYNVIYTSTTAWTDYFRGQVAVYNEVVSPAIWRNITYSPSMTSNVTNVFRLPNKLDVNCLGYGNYVVFGFAYELNGTSVDQFWTTISLSDFIADTPFTLTFGSYSFTAKPSDFAESTVYSVTDAGTGNVYRYALCMFCSSPNGINSVNGTLDSYHYIITHPMIKIHESFTGNDEEFIVGYNNAANWYLSDFDWTQNTRTSGCWVKINTGFPEANCGIIMNAVSFNAVFGGYFGSFSLSDLQTRQGNVEIYHPDDCNFCFVMGKNGNSSYCTMQRIYTYAEIYKVFSLNSRYLIDNTSGYYTNTGKIYAKVDLETNEFLTEFVDGTNSNELTSWQLINGTTLDNDFDPIDIPPYTPGNPNDEESGDSVPALRRVVPAFGNFMTVYALTGGELATFGDALWTSWFDQNGVATAMWENFKLMIDTGIASQTGSIDISSVLNFIVSCKIYPFDLHSAFAFVDSGSPKLFIGRGTYGLPIGASNLLRASTSVGYLLAGTADIPRVFDDFRDYNNMNITCYLPYCGTLELNPADVVGRTLNCFYAVDLWTGECTAYVEVLNAVGDDGMHRYIVGSVTGKIGFDVPLSATNSGQIAARRISDITGLVHLTQGFFNSNYQTAQKTAFNLFTQDGDGVDRKSDFASAQALINSKDQIVNNAMSFKNKLVDDFTNSLTRASISAPHMSGGSGFDSFATPECCYVQMRYGIYPEVTNYKHTVGETAAVTKSLSSVSGFTICNNVDVSSLSCTEEEKSEIKMLLESGVFL